MRGFNFHKIILRLKAVYSDASVAILSTNIESMGIHLIGTKPCERQLARASIGKGWDLREEQECLDRLKWAAETLNRVTERCRELGIGCVLENELPHLLFAQTSDVL